MTLQPKVGVAGMLSLYMDRTDRIKETE
jgi:hypothetical protein